MMLHVCMTVNGWAAYSNLDGGLLNNVPANVLVSRGCNFVIAPDVTSFDLSEFTRAEEMAVIGESTTDASIHKLKSMLSKLDSKLFS